MERNNTFTTMLEELNYQEMSEIMGGAMSYCDRLQEWAGTYGEAATDEQWDQWADYWEARCQN